MAESDVQAEPPEPRRSRKPAGRRRDREYDEEDETPRQRKARREREDDENYSDENEDTGVEKLIPYRNPKGLIAYYLGVFSFIPIVGLFLGPAALILGILGVRASSANNRAGGAGHAIAGIVMGSITTLIYWGILALILVAAGR